MHTLVFMVKTKSNENYKISILERISPFVINHAYFQSSRGGQRDEQLKVRIRKDQDKQQE
jgi:hypothetical protein